MKRLLLLVIYLSYFSFSSASELRFPIEQENTHTELSIEEQYLQSWWWPWSSDDTPKKPTFDVETVLKLEETIAQKIIGQPMAVKVTTNCLLSYAAGIHDGTRPIATLLYIGPTGVGKTELAKELARQLYKDESKFIRFNMSEYNVHYSMTRLIGSPNGYVDSHLGGQLSNAILKHPNSIVLLDEFEKAHPEIRALFLHIFEEGWFNSGRGAYVNCRDCIFIATSNLGANKILDLQSKGMEAEEILMDLEDCFIDMLSPELYNRVEPVIFTGLTNEQLKQIVPIRLKELSQRIYAQKKITVTFDETLVEYLREHGYNAQLGARPLQRLIKKEIESAIAKAMLQDKYQAGEAMHVSYDNGCIVVTKVS